MARDRLSPIGNRGPTEPKVSGSNPLGCISENCCEKKRGSLTAPGLWAVGWSARTSAEFRVFDLGRASLAHAARIAELIYRWSTRRITSLRSLALGYLPNLRHVRRAVLADAVVV